MEKETQTYLRSLEDNLGYLTIEERQEITNEVKSHIYEATTNGAELKEVLSALGSPKKLAKSYVGEAILKNNKFNLKNQITLFRFYLVTGFSGMIVVPFVSILSITLYMSSILVFIGGVAKFIGNLLGYQVPINMFDFQGFQMPNMIMLPLAIVSSILLYIASKKLWSWLKKYLQKISVSHRKIINEQQSI